MREPKAKRIGSVPYLNSAPLTFGIEGETEFLPPSRLAKRLRAGALVAVAKPSPPAIIDGVLAFTSRRGAVNAFPLEVDQRRKVRDQPIEESLFRRDDEHLRFF